MILYKIDNKIIRLLFSKQKINNKSGVILIIVLWILIILSIFALSIGRKTNLELSLVKNNISKTKAKYMAWAGLVYAISNIQKDTLDEESSKTDTFYFCGIRQNKDISPEMLFNHRKVGDGYFDVFYKQISDSPKDRISGTIIGETYSGNRNITVNNEIDAGFYKKKYYGMSDEERKIDINALTYQNYKILSNLIIYLGYDEGVANTIASSVVDWKDNNDIVTNGTYGAESEYYDSLSKSYHCKNAYFDSKEEIMLVKGMTKGIFNSIKDYITIFPKQDRLSINFDTATKPVMYSLARLLAGLSPTASDADADALIDKIFEFRNGDDGIEYTGDDNVVDLGKIAANAIERNIFLSMNRYRIKKSNYINIRVRGVDAKRDVMYNVNAIIFRDDMSIVSWHVY